MTTTQVCAIAAIATTIGFQAGQWTRHQHLATLRDVARQQLELSKKQLEVLQGLVDAHERIDTWEGDI